MMPDYEEARAVAYEQMRWWIKHGVSPQMAFYALTGRRRRYGMWSEIDGELIRWWIRNQERLAA